MMDGLDTEKARKSLNQADRWLQRMVLDGESLRDNEVLAGVVRRIAGWSGTLEREERRLPLR